MDSFGGWIVRIVRNDGTVALLLALFVVALLVATAPDIGLTWDEPAYIVASESYIAWLGQIVTRPRYALSEEGILHYWEPNHEHPPMDKLWSGLVWIVARFILDDLTAHRLGNIVLVGVLVALLYLMVAQELGRMAGLAAAGALITMPRFFFHAHLAALDVPAAFAVFVLVFVFWRTADRPGLKWDVLLGLIWGLALATKINAIFVPPTLLLWMLLVRRRLYLFRRLILMGIVGAPLFVLIWPWLYRQFPDWLIWYILFVTVDHWEIGQWYLGHLYMPPPWHFPFVIALAVVPLTLTILYILGMLRVAIERRRRALGTLLIVCALLPMLALATGKSMVYDNDRLFMPSFPYLAALSGFGFGWLIEELRRFARQLKRPALVKAVPPVVVWAIFAPHIVLAGNLYPHLLSYYSESIGGLPGAARLGLETTYWCETYAEALPYLNAHAQRGDVVWVEDWSHDVMFYYQLRGDLDPHLRIAWTLRAITAFRRQGVRGVLASIAEADYVVIQHRQTGFTDEIRDWLRGKEPVYRLSHRDIPLMEIYAR